MRVIVTRPEADAQAWLDAIQKAGHEAVFLPLIEIGPAPDLIAVEHAWQNWSRWHAVMFVSAQAVRMFFAQRPQYVSFANGPSLKAEADQSHGPRYWATGPGTRQALIEAGVVPAAIDAPNAESAQFDSEALWRVVGPLFKNQAPVLIVRGTQEDMQQANPEGLGRDWLAQHLVDAGGCVEFVVAYSRYLPRWSDQQVDTAKLAACDGSVWCFSSSQAILYLQAQLPGLTWNKARCIATHARIAQTAREAGFSNVTETRPVLSDVLASLESSA